ncbi:hypothetical protein JCGZ_19561 [Jatropha curcas]|uniref:Uncharacterized protein n=1 Tax=Jatropha curcas TaxID=180498 RepID=A0A067K789_JATCU|nr:hypothetical protein JCGZ_19561 [Jatropha curcas]
MVIVGSFNEYVPSLKGLAIEIQSFIKDSITKRDRYRQVVAKVNIAAHQVSELKKCREDLLEQVDALKAKIALLEGEAVAIAAFEECLNKEYITKADFVKTKIKMIKDEAP